MKYDLVIVTMESFPQGMAATNRILSYAKGIAKEHKVLFLTYAGPFYGENPLNKEQKGLYENIEFRYMSKPYLSKKPNKLFRLIALIFRMLKLYFFVTFKYTYKSMLLYTRNVSLTQNMRIICNLKQAYLYNDVTEAAGAQKSRKSLQERKKSCECFDGIIAISQGIYNDFLDNIHTKKKYILPVLVDLNRFTEKKATDEKYFFCCSGANLERDGLLDCLRGFLLFNKKHPGYQFRIASAFNLNDEYHKQCKSIIDDNSDKIKYLGSLPANQIPHFLVNATALMLTPHKNYITKGFPTKLGEYLASGTPTICSTIDDLVEVVEENCVYWVSPNNPLQICEQLEFIIQNPTHAEEKASAGRNMMEKHYTYDAYKDSLLNFLRI